MTIHPAKYSDELLPVMAGMLYGRRCLLDPFAGSGKVFSLQSFLPDCEIEAVEIEPEWAAMHPRTTVGNALHLPWPDRYFDAVCSSPTYGNRMSDHHVARDASKRNTYTHALGRPLHPDNSGAMPWGPAYWDLHQRAWREARRVLEPGGAFVLNTKDFYKTMPASRAHLPYRTVTATHDKRALVRVQVTCWHWDVLASLGFVRLEAVDVPLLGNRQGANGERRVGYETVAHFVLEGV